MPQFYSIKKYVWKLFFRCESSATKNLTLVYFPYFKGKYNSQGLIKGYYPSIQTLNWKKISEFSNKYLWFVNIIDNFIFAASRGGMQAPPPYVPPQNQWYAAPPPAYAPPPQGKKPL